MSTSLRREEAFSRMLLRWAADRLLRAMAAIRPAHSAGQIATVVAASGNPAGA